MGACGSAFPTRLQQLPVLAHRPRFQEQVEGLGAQALGLGSQAQPHPCHLLQNAEEGNLRVPSIKRVGNNGIGFKGSLEVREKMDMKYGGIGFKSNKSSWLPPLICAPDFLKESVSSTRSINLISPGQHGEWAKT